MPLQKSQGLTDTAMCSVHRLCLQKDVVFQTNLFSHLWCETALQSLFAQTLLCSFFLQTQHWQLRLSAGSLQVCNSLTPAYCMPRL